MTTGLLGLLILILLLILLGSGTPIFVSLGFLSIIGIVAWLDLGNLYQLAEIAADSGTNLFMITLPLFILMAEIVSFSGVGDDIYTAANKWLNWLPGGLAVSSIATCAGFAAISGSSPATAATVGLVAIPEMVKRGYSKKLAAGVIAVGGTLGILIPPSITMIIYGLITETSIGKLFIAGVIPGVFMAVMLSAAVVIAVKVKPSLAPQAEPHVSWRERFGSLRRIWPFLILVLSILGTIYTGVATPTESAAIGATVAIIIAWCYGRLKVRTLNAALMRTVGVTAVILFLMIGGNSLAFLMSTLGIPQYVTEAIVAMQMSKWTIMVVINIILLILGCLLDPMAIMIISLPILFPIVTKLGFDPVWFGIVVTINIEAGMITPPVGLNLFILKGTIRELTMGDISAGSAPFVALLCLGIVILSVFPGLATWLPSQMGF